MKIEHVEHKKIFVLNDKKGYRIAYDMGKFKIETPKISLPFGIELYNGKEILNIDINNQTNTNINFINGIQLLENIFKQFSKDDKSIKQEYPYVKLPPDFFKDSSIREFSPSVKKNFTGHLLRTHLKNTIIVDSNGSPIDKKNLVKANCHCQLELASVWVYGNKYGLLWNVNKIITE